MDLGSPGAREERVTVRPPSPGSALDDASRARRQDEMGRDLAQALREDEVAWLDADLT